MHQMDADEEGHSGLLRIRGNLRNLCLISSVIAVPLTPAFAGAGATGVLDVLTHRRTSVPQRGVRNGQAVRRDGKYWARSGRGGMGGGLQGPCSPNLKRVVRAQGDELRRRHAGSLWRALKRETEIIAKLRHPNMVRLFTVGQRGQPRLVHDGFHRGQTARRPHRGRQDDGGPPRARPPT